MDRDPGSRGTEPLPPQGPYGATTPIRGPLGGRRRRPTVSGRVVLAALAALGVAFALGFFAGNAGEAPGGVGEEPAAAGRGGRRACRRAVVLAAQTVQLQREALQNRAEFSRAALSGDERGMLSLNQELEPLSAELQQLEPRMNAAAERCRSGRRGGGRGGGGGGD